MKVSVCLTIYNEEKSISALLQSLLGQTKSPEEIVIVDGGSTDKTVSLIRHFQKKHKKIKLLVQKCTRAEGRNLSIELAKNEIVAITDGDCTADSTWLKNITDPFKHKEIDMVAGFYKMVADTPRLKALSYFLGVTPKRFDETFLPSTRSIAFRRGLWERIGGFPELSDNSAEDTDFNYNVVKSGARIARVKNAIVYWQIPVDIKGSIKKFYDYAKWDARRLILWHPTQKLRSHNIRALLKLIRYSAGLVILLLAFKNPVFLIYFAIGVILYSYWAYRKVHTEFQDNKVAFWGIVIQYMSDYAVISGFLNGLFVPSVKK